MCASVDISVAHRSVRGADQMHVSQKVLRALSSVNKVLAVIVGIPSGCTSHTQVSFPYARARTAPGTPPWHVVPSVLVAPDAPAPAIPTSPICGA